MVFGINFGLAVNNAVNKTTTELSNTQETDVEQKALTEAYGSSKIDWKNTGTINCKNLQVSSKSTATATAVASLIQKNTGTFNSNVAKEIIANVQNQVKQKNKNAIFDANVGGQLNKVLNEDETKIANAVNTAINQITVTKTVSDANAQIINEGTISGDECKFLSNGVAITLSKNIISSLSQMYSTNELSIKMDLQARTTLDQTNESSPLMLLLIAAVILGPLILGGGGGAAGGSIVSAVVFLMISIGLGVALFFINDKIVCDNKDESEPKVKDECNDKTDKEKRENACLECEDDVKVKRKKSILWIICLSMCILCGFISIISFGIYFSEGSNSSQGNLEEYQNNLGGGSKEFKKFKKFITSILK